MQQIRIDFDNPGLPQSLGAVEGESQSRIFQAALYKSGAGLYGPGWRGVQHHVPWFRPPKSGLV